MADEPKGVRINTKIPNLCSLRFGFIASTIRLLYIIYLDAGGWIRNGYGWPFKRLSILRSTRRMSMAKNSTRTEPRIAKLGSLKIKTH